MVFSSQIFLFYFLPFALLLYYAFPRSFRLPVLTAVSLVFYAKVKPEYTLLLVWSICVDFTCGNLIYGRWRLIGPVTRLPDGTTRASNVQRKLFLFLSLASNLGILCFFKYAEFLGDSVNELLGAAHVATLTIPQVLLPAGISFYTFESISYVLDIYFGKAKPASAGVPGECSWLVRELRGLNAFACYITQFPHLVAGPIIRFQDLEGQLHHREHRIDKFARGIFFFSLGMAKKVLLANPLGDIAGITFDQSLHMRSLDAWFGLAAYSFQIYFDFSGYTDMAIGLALMMGFEFSKNFDSPYKAHSITDFWRRWHISLSTWLRDYLYIPLGGNRKGETLTYFNLITVMLLGGLWHGAAWKYVVWGGIHGGWLVVERLLGKRSFYSSSPAALRVMTTFLIVSIAWVFFRATGVADALHYLLLMVKSSANGPLADLMATRLYTRLHVTILFVSALIALFGVQTWDLSKRVTPARAAMALGLFAISIGRLATQSSNPFLYFQF